MSTTVDGNSGGTALTTTGVLTTQGQVLQIVNYQTGAVATGSTTVPTDNTIPQNTEGDQYMSLAIIPRSESSVLVIEVVVHASTSAHSGTNIVAALFKDSDASALALGWQASPSASHTQNINFNHSQISGGTSSQTFKVRVGVGTSGTTTFNGYSSTEYYGGVIASSITITEVVP